MLSVANLDAAAWLWSAIAREAPAFLEREGRRELHATAGHVRLRLREAEGANRPAVQPIDLAVGPESMSDILQAAAHAGFTARPLDDGSGAHVVTIAPGVELMLHAQSPANAPAGPVPPPGRLVRRPPRAEAPRAKQPERRKPEAGRAAPESSARTPRRIVRPRGQVRKAGKK